MPNHRSSFCIPNSRYRRQNFSDRSLYEIEAFGDSRGDKEMLVFADKGHYKPFRE